jgi:hypothetical protein
MDDRDAESGKVTRSIPPAQRWDNTYRHRNGVGGKEASKRESDEASDNRLRGGLRGVNRELGHPRRGFGPEDPENGLCKRLFKGLGGSQTFNEM